MIKLSSSIHNKYMYVFRSDRPVRAVTFGNTRLHETVKHSLNTMHVSINSITSKFQYILVAFGLFLIYNCAFVVEKSCVFKEYAPKGASRTCIVQKLPRVMALTGLIIYKIDNKYLIRLYQMTLSFS